MLTAIGQYVGAKVITAVLFVSSALTVIWFWRNPEQLQAIWQVVKYAMVWLGVVLVVPWAGFFVTRWVVSLESNAATGLMLLGYVVADAVVAFVLIGRVVGLGGLTWMVLLLGFLSAGVYNYLVCEFQASRLEDV
jgi:hypothetical protein